MAQQGASPEGARYVASTHGEVYYWIGCDAWKRLAEGNRIYFPSAAEAEAAGVSSVQVGGVRPSAEEATGETVASRPDTVTPTA